ncbi:hypothetical protein B005_5527 [Nocardiopsis alba ATCC BAA-2165]|uniref:Uncharacterized protein n=1 Tax=Nocardiopsis alba (strain ATCC BAA-2165 / BE74) TaxID=1205910 RepID=J7LF96_NOCAA|nr:hypothetical protein B005_5527 [Nocardiopsis alba ATCC BAA-2165]
MSPRVGGTGGNATTHSAQTDLVWEIVRLTPPSSRATVDSPHLCRSPTFTTTISSVQYL